MPKLVVKLNTLFLLNVENTLSVHQIGEEPIYNQNLIRSLKNKGVKSVCLLTKMTSPKNLKSTMLQPLLTLLEENGIEVEAVYTPIDSFASMAKHIAQENSDRSLPDSLREYTLGSFYNNAIRPTEEALQKLLQEASVPVMLDGELRSLENLGILENLENLENLGNLKIIETIVALENALQFWQTYSKNDSNSHKKKQTNSQRNSIRPYDIAAKIDEQAKERKRITTEALDAINRACDNHELSEQAGSILKTQIGKIFDPALFTQSVEAFLKNSISSIKDSCLNPEALELLKILLESQEKENEFNITYYEYYKSFYNEDPPSEAPKAWLLSDVLDAHPNVENVVFIDDQYSKKSNPGQLKFLDDAFKNHPKIVSIVSQPPMPYDVEDNKESDVNSFNSSDRKQPTRCIPLETFEDNLSAIVQPQRKIVYLNWFGTLADKNDELLPGALEYLQTLAQKNMGVVIITSLEIEDARSTLVRNDLTALDLSTRDLDQLPVLFNKENILLLNPMHIKKNIQDFVIRLPEEQEKINLTNSEPFLIKVLSSITNTEPFLFAGNSPGMKEESCFAGIPFFIAPLCVKEGEIQSLTQPFSEESNAFFRILHAYQQLKEYIENESYNREGSSVISQVSWLFSQSLSCDELKKVATKFLKRLEEDHGVEDPIENDENFKKVIEGGRITDYLLTPILKSLYNDITLISRYKNKKLFIPKVVIKPNTLFLLDVDNTLFLPGVKGDNLYNENLIKSLKEKGVTSICLLTNMAPPKKVDAAIRSELIAHLKKHGIEVEAVYSPIDINVMAAKRKANSLETENLPLPDSLQSYTLGSGYSEIIEPAEKALEELKRMAKESNVQLKDEWVNYQSQKDLEKGLVFWESLANENLEQKTALQKVEDNHKKGFLSRAVYGNLTHTIRASNNEENEIDHIYSYVKNSLINSIDKHKENVTVNQNSLDLFDIMLSSLEKEEKLLTEYCNYMMNFGALPRNMHKASLLGDILNAHPDTENVVFIDDDHIDRPDKNQISQLTAMKNEFAEYKITGIISAPPMPYHKDRTPTTEANIVIFNGKPSKEPYLCIPVESFEENLSAVVQPQRKIVYLDWTGTLADENNNLYPGALNYIKRLNDDGVGVVIITNQVADDIVSQFKDHDTLPLLLDENPDQLTLSVSLNTQDILILNPSRISNNQYIKPLIDTQQEKTTYISEKPLVISALSSITYTEPSLFSDDAFEIKNDVCQSGIPFFIAHPCIKGRETQSSIQPSSQQSEEFFKGLYAYHLLKQYIEGSLKSFNPVSQFSQDAAIRFLNKLEEGHSRENFLDDEPEIKKIMEGEYFQLTSIFKDIYIGIILKYDHQNPAIFQECQQVQQETQKSWQITNTSSNSFSVMKRNTNIMFQENNNNNNNNASGSPGLNWSRASE